MGEINYTTINHTARIKLGLSWLEYGLADLIYHLSNKPDSASPNWCYASKEWLGKSLGITRQHIHKNTNRLIKLGIIEKHPTTKYLKTTKLWFDNVITNNQKLQGVTKGYTVSTKVTPDSKQRLHNNNINNNNNITPLYISPLRKYSSLKEITKNDVLEISQLYKISPGFVELQLESLRNYCESKGKTYKNYKAALRNFVLGEIKRIVIKDDFNNKKKGIDATAL